MPREKLLISTAAILPEKFLVSTASGSERVSIGGLSREASLATARGTDLQSAIKLLLPQRHQRINLRCAPRRDVAGRERHARQREEHPLP